MTEQQFAQCCDRIRKGDQDGLKDIYTEYVSFIYAVINRILMDRENAEDVTSEFFIKLWTLADRYEPGRGHKGWLAAIARNMAIDHIRAHKREVLVDPMPDMAGEESGEHMAYAMQQAAAADDVEQEVLGEITIQEALARLNPAEAQIINMKILGDMTFREIAETLEIPMGTVTWRYQNALNKLRRCGYET